MDNILKTLAYFDIFNTPLTREELFHSLWEEKITDYAGFARRLDDLSRDTTRDPDFMSGEKQHLINTKNGYYFLPGREEIVNIRERTVPLIEGKMQIAVRGAKKIRFIPYVEAMFVCNTVASGNVKKESDIDVLIIIKNGRLWLARFLTTVILSLFGLRRNKIHITDKICLSFYVTDDNLDFSKIKIADPDIYLVYWLYNLIPVYDPNNILKKIKHQNQWAKKYLPNTNGDYQTLYRWAVIDSKLSKIIKYFFAKAWTGGYGDLLETQAKKIQEVKMKLLGVKPSFAKATVGKENKLGVIINDNMLKFHESDRREQYQSEWQQKLQNF